MFPHETGCLARRDIARDTNVSFHSDVEHHSPPPSPPLMEEVQEEEDRVACPVQYMR